MSADPNSPKGEPPTLAASSRPTLADPYRLALLRARP